MFNPGLRGECLLMNLFMESWNGVYGKEHVVLPSQFADEETEVQGGDVRAGLVAEQGRDLGRPIPSAVFPQKIVSH